MRISVIGKDWHSKLREHVARTKKSLFVCSPFITVEGCELLRASLSQSFRQNGRLAVLSDLSPIHLVQQSTDPRALKVLLSSVNNGTLWHLPRVHAKVFVFDLAYAVVTSANLTAGGLYRNIECGLGIAERSAVAQINRELESLGPLSARIDPPRLDRYCELAQAVQSQLADQVRSVVATAKAKLEDALRTTENELLRWRADGGRVTPLFQKTILFLLERRGPLTTQELQPLVQELHPDLCDDSIDRVIDGVHFGKRWKHWVRSAQHHLKASGRVTLRDGKWCIPT